MRCESIVKSKCPNGHSRNQKCYQAQLTLCAICEAEDRQRQKDLEVDNALQDKRDVADAAHLADIAELDRKILLIREQRIDKRTALQRLRALNQKKSDLEAAKKMAQSSTTPTNPSANEPTLPAPSTTISVTPRGNLANYQKSPRTHPKLNESEAEAEWKQQKKVEGASNEAIDALIGLTGLESVKKKVLAIKAKIETISRQGIEYKERLSVAMLGNPGTGRPSQKNSVDVSNNEQAKQQLPESTGSSWFRLKRCLAKNLWRLLGPA
jgi:hypothetical protein